MSDKWPATAFASALLLLVGVVAVGAIVKYSAEDALKIWSGLAGLTGVITGNAATFFFNRPDTDRVRAFGKIAAKLEPSKIQELKQSDPL